ncbi:MAG: transglutaminase-like domain-containing protein [Candidatus Thermoplasmatota archaeon]|nr:transglutaminase-like domain-containing protein [Candidatus Thermoplasmatota archaeon]
MKKTTTIIMVLTLVITSISFISNAQIIKLGNIEIDLCGINQNLSLLRGEHYLYITANQNVISFNIKYSFPPEYGYQHPIYLEILDDTNANILNYKIEDDIFEPNKIINFTCGQIKKGDRVLIHFNCWVLVREYNYEDLPNFIEIPKYYDLPDEVKKWTSPTEVVQSDHYLIKFRAKELKLFSDNNLLKIANNIAKFSKYHRYLFFITQYKLQRIFQYPSQDALTTLLVNGECPGRSHLGCALFRANGIPARVTLSMPTRYDFWYEIHYTTQYYCPGFDWILTEVHAGITPYPPQNQIILRFCYPGEENNTQADYIYHRMKSLERWMWFDNENIKPYYNHFKEGSTRIRSFNVSSVNIDLNIANETIDLTKIIYNKYQQFLSANLTGENLINFEKGKQFIEKAINELGSSDDSFGYIYYLNKANDIFDSIII